jgi:hypothetical protein
MNDLTPEQKEKLADLVVDSWDLKILLQFAVDTVLNMYLEDDEAAKRDAVYIEFFTDNPE